MKLMYLRERHTHARQPELMEVHCTKLRVGKAPQPVPNQVNETKSNEKHKAQSNNIKESPIARSAKQVRNPCQKLGIPTRIKLESEPQVPGQL
eukprot:6491710-Amphidinium_carterae.1